MRYNKLHGRTRKLDAIKETGKLKGHKMAPGLDPGCDITYKNILIQRSLHILAFVQLAHSTWFIKPFLAWRRARAGHETNRPEFRTLTVRPSPLLNDTITAPIYPSPNLFSNSNIHTAPHKAKLRRGVVPVVGHGLAVQKDRNPRIGKGIPLKTSIFKHLPKTITAPPIWPINAPPI